jgi:hypothetical protein
MRRDMALLLIALLTASAGVAHARELKEFATEKLAQDHCPKDTVVWSEVKGGGYYHLRGSTWYGKTSDGAYLCLGEAERAGWKEYPKRKS